MIFFTSDLHFYHGNIMKYCPKFRDFNDVNEMNEKLIELWNAVVGPEDTVYDLGDFAFCNKLKDLKSVARRLNGSHVLILGNHDTLISQNKEALLRELKDDGNPIFSDILHYKELNFDGGAGEGWQNGYEHLYVSLSHRGAQPRPERLFYASRTLARPRFQPRGAHTKRRL